MRFLQTEWHRHERDRNAWEIERQEMKARIANLEGSARRADATQKALQKYVTILQNKVKEQATQLKGGAISAEEDKHKTDRAALLQEKLRCKSLLPSIPRDNMKYGRSPDILRHLQHLAPSRLKSPRSRSTARRANAQTRILDATNSKPTSTNVRRSLPT
jgi:hypothetical protein